MACTQLYPRPASTLQEVAGKGVDLEAFYSDIGPRMCGKLFSFRESLYKDRTDHWLEYVPDSYSSFTPVPLIITVHGGGQTDFGQFYETSWYRVAERTGAIIVCPQIPPDGMTGFMDAPAPSDEILMIDKLIEHVKEKYSIDPGRMFMQGMSMGDLISTQYGRYFGHKLAGIGLTAGPTAPSKLFDGDQLLHHDGPVAVWQSRGAFDDLITEPGRQRSDINIANRRYWMQLNGSTELPRLRLSYNENWAYYPGRQAPLVYRDYTNHGHNQSCEDAECAWDTLFSRVRRDAQGSIVVLAELPEGDRNAVVLLDGSSCAYVDNERVKLDAPAFIETEYTMPFVPRPGSEKSVTDQKPEPAVMDTYTYVPVSFLEKAFGAVIRKSDGRTAELTTADGRALCFADQNLGAMLEGRVYDMGRTAKTIDGVLFVPVEWYAQWVAEKCVSKKDGTVYIGPRPGKLTNDMVRIIAEILGPSAD
jgi:poly(3-hydroxybutyrate) depolymerase